MRLLSACALAACSGALALSVGEAEQRHLYPHSRGWHALEPRPAPQHEAHSPHVIGAAHELDIVDYYDGLGFDTTTRADEANAANAPSPPPMPPACVSDQCAWSGPKRLIYVAPLGYAAYHMAEVMSYVTKHTGMPYAWQGKHRAWQQDAKARGFQCSKGEFGRGEDPNNDPVTCMCFTEYLYAYNLTADGLWICNGAAGSRFTNMLETVMPNAEWFTTVRSPWEHVITTFQSFQLSRLNGTKSVMKANACDYGYNTEDRVGIMCFVDMMADPALKHCSADSDKVKTASPLCALGFDERPRAAALAKKYLVLPAENAITPLLAALHGIWSVPEAVTLLISEDLEAECRHGGSLGIDPSYLPEAPPSKNTHVDHDIAGGSAAGLARKRREYLSSGVEAFLLHQHAFETAAELTKDAKNDARCWDNLFKIPPRVELPSQKPHADADRLPVFDNAHNLFQQLRLDMCTPGMPQALDKVSNFNTGQPATTSAQAQAMLSPWLQLARAHEPTCFTHTGIRQDLSVPHAGDSLVAPDYKVVFQTAAKVASQSAEHFFECRLGYHRPDTTTGPSIAQPDYLRATMVRDPKKRIFASIGQTMMHYLDLLRVSPEDLAECAAQFPSGVNFTRDIKNRLLQHDVPMNKRCVEAWTVNAITNETNSNVPQFSVDEARNTAKGHLYNALWAKDLPSSCRTLFHYLATGPDKGKPTASHLWYCDRHDCEDECVITDEVRAKLIASALADSASTTSIGCAGNLFGDEHMWPQFMHTGSAGRVDAALRLESIDKDSMRLETAIEQHANKSLGPRGTIRRFDGVEGEVDCTMGNIHVNEQTDLHTVLDNHTHTQLVVLRSHDLQQRICALYYHDFVCGGYELYDACKPAPEKWLKAAMRRLLANAPVELGAPCLNLDSATFVRAGPVATWVSNGTLTMTLPIHEDELTCSDGQKTDQHIQLHELYTFVAMSTMFKYGKKLFGASLPNNVPPISVTHADGALKEDDGQFYSGDLTSDQTENLRRSHVKTQLGMAITAQLRDALLAQGLQPEQHLFPVYAILGGNTVSNDKETGLRTSEYVFNITKGAQVNYTYNKIMYRGACSNMERRATANYPDVFNTSCAYANVPVALPMDEWPIHKYLFLSSGGEYKEQNAFEARGYWVMFMNRVIFQVAPANGRMPVSWHNVGLKPCVSLALNELNGCHYVPIDNEDLSDAPAKWATIEARPNVYNAIRRNLHEYAHAHASVVHAYEHVFKLMGGKPTRRPMLKELEALHLGTGQLNASCIDPHNARDAGEA